MARHLRLFAIGLGMIVQLAVSLLVQGPRPIRTHKIYSSADLANLDSSLHVVDMSTQEGAVALLSSLAGFGPSKLPIQDKGGQVFSVKAYGAKGDGIANDSLAFQSAYNAAVSAGGGVVYIPSSSSCYLLSTAINMTEDSHLVRILGSRGFSADGYGSRGAICANTGGVLFDLTNSGQKIFENVDVTAQTGVKTPSLVGILYARNNLNSSGTHDYVINCRFAMPLHSTGTVNSFGAYLYGQELTYMTRDVFVADYPLVVSATNDFNIASPFDTVGTGLQSETQNSFTDMELDTSGLGNAAYFSGTWDMTLTGHSWNFNTVNPYPVATLQPYSLKFLQTNHAMFVKWRQEGFPGFLQNNLSLYNSQIYGTHAPFSNASTKRQVHAVEFEDASSNIIHDNFAVEDEYPFTTANNYYDSSEGATTGIAILDDVDFSCGGQTNCVNIPIGNYNPGYRTYWREIRWSGQANNQHPKISLGYAVGAIGPITGSFVVSSGTVVNANSCTSLKAQTGLGINISDFFIEFNNVNVYHALLTADNISSGSFVPSLCNPTSSNIIVGRNVTEYWRISRQ
jgi:Pectate lyase superfamily protein